MYDEIFDISGGRAYIYVLRPKGNISSLMYRTSGALMISYICVREEPLLIFARATEGARGKRLCEYVRLSCICSRGGCNTMSRACRVLVEHGIVPLASSCSESEILFLLPFGKGEATAAALREEFFVL